MKIKRLMPLLLAMFALTGCGSSSSQKNEIESIYEQYKDTGGSLSYEEWLKSIKGEKGDTGPQGIQGPQGTQGEKGNDGHSPVITIGENGNWLDEVYVIGNSRGLGLCINKCSISSPAKELSLDNNTYKVIQINGTINEVESGGPL